MNEALEFAGGHGIMLRRSTILLDTTHVQTLNGIVEHHSLQPVSCFATIYYKLLRVHGPFHRYTYLIYSQLNILQIYLTQLQAQCTAAHFPYQHICVL